MRDVNNNVEIGKAPQPIAPAKTDAVKVDKTGPQIPQKGEEKIADFSNPKAEVLGRSQVQGANTVEKDVAFGVKNPNTITQANSLFDMAYDKAISQGMNGEEAYKQAAGIMDAYANEFSAIQK